MINKTDIIEAEKLVDELIVRINNGRYFLNFSCWELSKIVELATIESNGTVLSSHLLSSHYSNTTLSGIIIGWKRILDYN